MRMLPTPNKLKRRSNGSQKLPKETEKRRRSKITTAKVRKARRERIHHDRRKRKRRKLIPISKR